MKVNELVLQMAYAASQMAQQTMPQLSQNQNKSGKSDFQALLEGKRSLDSRGNDPYGRAEQLGYASSGSQQTAESAATSSLESGVAQFSKMMTGMATAPLLEGMPMLELPLDLEGMVTSEEAMLPELLPQELIMTPVQKEGQEAPVITQGVPVLQEESMGEKGQEVQEGQELLPLEEGTLSVEGSNETDQQLTDFQSAPGQSTEEGVQQEDQDTWETEVEGFSQPVFRNMKHIPHRVGDAPVVDTEAPDFEGKLGKELTKALHQGVQRVEIQLTPQNLGRVVVEMTQSPDGILRVVLHAEGERAIRLLSDHANQLGMALQNSQQTQVQVEVQRPHQGEQPWQNPDQGQHQQQQQQNKREQTTDPEQFLQQLRLGLIGQEEV